LGTEILKRATQASPLGGALRCPVETPVANNSRALGRTQQVWLFSAARVPIRRHIKVRSNTNPYDPADEVYFAQRLGVKMERTRSGRPRLLRLWKEQEGLCPVYHHKITTRTGWHNHHLTW